MVFDSWHSRYEIALCRSDSTLLGSAKAHRQLRIAVFLHRTRLGDALLENFAFMKCVLGKFCNCMMRELYLLVVLCYTSSNKFRKFQSSRVLVFKSLSVSCSRGIHPLYLSWFKSWNATVFVLSSSGGLKSV